MLFCRREFHLLREQIAHRAKPRDRRRSHAPAGFGSCAAAIVLRVRARRRTDNARQVGSPAIAVEGLPTTPYAEHEIVPGRTIPPAVSCRNRLQTPQGAISFRWASSGRVARTTPPCRGESRSHLSS